MNQNIKQNKRTEIKRDPTSGARDTSSRRRRENDTIIGKYRFVRTLGKGNFAKVLLAKHIPTDYLVAVKVIDKSQLSKVGLEKLYREVKMLEKIDHPSIVKLYEVIERETTLYLVMEYLSGGEIFDYLVAHGRMKEKDARSKFRQIAAAVQYCHKKYIVHRDLKAENLLLDHNLNVKLADFGFSNEFCPGKKLDTFCGSPPYAAPELFRGEKYTGPEVDVWSLGVILFTLISGSLPFDGQNLKEVREKVLCGRYRIPFYMSTDCEHLIKKLMSHNPAKRPSLDVVMNDKWINTGYDENRLLPFVEPPERQMDHEAVDKIEKMGYERSRVIESIEIRAFDEISATYDILLAMKAASQESTSSDRIQRASTLRSSVRTTRPANGTTLNRSIESAKPRPRENVKPKIPSFINTKPEICPEIRGSPGNKPFLKNGGYLRTSVYNPKRPDDDGGSRFSSVNQSFRISQKKTTAPPVPSSSTLTRKPDVAKPVKENDKPFSVKSVRSSFIERIKGSKKSPPSNEADKPRALKFTWSMKTSSLKPPDDVLAELMRALRKCEIEFEQTSKFVLLCVSGSVSDRENFVQFESEVCQLPRVGMHGVKFKRISGSSIAFKQVGQLVTNSLIL